VDQHTHCGITKRKRRKAEKLFGEIMTPKLPTFDERHECEPSGSSTKYR
jgi:hypothetical protein